jgi:branched-chain amino acid aminotransferase
VTGGRVERVERHVRRLIRDAARLELPLPNAADVERLLVDSARETFGIGDGIVHMEWSCKENEPPELIALPRPIGTEKERWLAAQSKAIHPGIEHRRNTKCVDVDVYDIARAEVNVEGAGIDEVLLFDANGMLVEGGRSNFLVVLESGQLVTPDRALGSVEGLGLTIVLESLPEIAFAELRHDDIAAARELMSVNAVRGVVPIVELDGRRIGDGQPGIWSRRLLPLFRSV